MRWAGAMQNLNPTRPDPRTGGVGGRAFLMAKTGWAILRRLARHESQLLEQLPHGLAGHQSPRRLPYCSSRAAALKVMPEGNKSRVSGVGVGVGHCDSSLGGAWHLNRYTSSSRII